MAKTMIWQGTQVHPSYTYDDTLPSGVALESSNSLEGDLNAIRSQLKKIIGGTDWFEQPPSSLASAVSSALDSEAHKILRQLVHLADTSGPLDGFTSGAYREILPSASIFPISVTWYESVLKLKKIVSKNINWLGILPTSISYQVYDEDGITVLITVTDNITYSGIFEISRIRSIS